MPLTKLFTNTEAFIKRNDSLHARLFLDTISANRAFYFAETLSFCLEFFFELMSFFLKIFKNGQFPLKN